MTLQQFFQRHPNIAIAFSGGTDSSYLLYQARQYAKDVAAICVKTPFFPKFELADVRRFARAYDIPLTVATYDILQNDTVTENPADRCYHCKTAMLKKVTETARELGFADVADGTNASDNAAERPGMRALAEQNILSPLRLCGLTKEQIRKESRRLGLFPADKPAYSCLATRIPTGMQLTADLLEKVEAAESALLAMGFSDFRVRVRENGARLEMKKEQIPLLLDNKDTIYDLLEPLFGEVYLDFESRG